MDASKLIGSMTKIAPLTSELGHAILSCLKEEKRLKRELLLEEGQLAKRIYFIQKGFCRAFYYKDGKEYTTWFMGEGDFMVSVFGFFTQQPSVENIELLEDTVLFSMTWENLQRLYLEFPEFNRFGRIITERYYIQSEERAIALRTLPAKERYKSLINTYPTILKKASLGQIASYLGVSQETLSRIRGQK